MRNLYIFSVVIFIILGVFFLVYYKFQDMQKFIINTNYKTNIEYVKKISTNMANEIVKNVNLDIVKSLEKNPKLRNRLENELSLFITNRYKYIYVVQKYQNEFRFLLDGSIKDKAIFLEPYEPIELNKWQEVYLLKKDIYFTHKKIHTLWITYLKPIIKHNKIIGILVIDFSMEEHNKIKEALHKLDIIFKILVYFFIFMFFIILFFSYVDYKRTKELEKLNKTLENRVKEEIEKNRQKDKQLFYQTKLAQMGEMMSMIAHQWRQPLSSISATAMGVNIRAKMGDIKKEFVIEKMDSINKYTTYLSETIEDFRNFFKPAKQKELVSFEDILNSVNNIIGNSLSNNNVELNIDIKYNKKFYIYANELKQVLLNVLKNAEDIFIERNIEHRIINLQVYKIKDKILIKIKDNAGGIDKENMDKIFDPYFSTKSFKNGTGLGLYMSKIIVEKHLNGKIDVYNDKYGAIFEIYIKVDDES